MQISITVKHRGKETTTDFQPGYLNRFVKLNKKYPVSYSIQGDKRIEEPCMTLGKDLTNPMIVELFIKQLL